MNFAYLIEPPFNYRMDDGTVTGSDVELARAILPMIGIDEFEPIETEFAELLPGVASGRWRMTTGLFGTKERRKTASFSRPIWALPDGLLVKKNNPKNLLGYASIAKEEGCVLAVIRDQFQHRSAVEFGVSVDRILVFETYTEAASAVVNGQADAYASVGRAHSGFIEQNSDLTLEVITVPFSEKEPAFGSFAFNKNDSELRQAIDNALTEFLGTKEHRAMMADFGFANSEVDLVTP